MLQRLAGGAHKISQRRDVRAVGTNAPGIDWQAEALRQIQIHARIV